MDFTRPVFYVLGLVSSSVCCLCWFTVMVMVFRWRGLRTVDRLQSRLVSWAAEDGYRIVWQGRPPGAPLLHRIFVTGPLAWLVLPRDCPWVFDLHWASFGWKRPSYSTRVVLRNRAGQLRQGRMQYLGSTFAGFWGQVESRWDEDDDRRPPEPTPPEPTPPDPRDDPLWDHWVDSPEAR